jgi:hypothetical protein
VSIVTSEKRSDPASLTPTRLSSARRRACSSSEREGLHEVVVGSGVEPGDAVADGVSRREHEHRRLVVGRADAAADLEPVDVRHQHVEDYGVGRVRGEALQRLETVLGKLDLVPLDAQGALERRADGGLVVDHEDTHARSVPGKPERALRGA